MGLCMATLSHQKSRGQNLQPLYIHISEKLSIGKTPKTNKNFAEDLLIKLSAEYNSPRNRTEHYLAVV